MLDQTATTKAREGQQQDMRESNNRTEPYPHDEVSRWGKWGAGDERGAANFITPAQVVAAAQLIQVGRVISMGAPINRDLPVVPGRVSPMLFMTSNGTDSWQLDDTALDHFNDDFLVTHVQGATHWDGLSHVWCDDALYNGYSAAESIRLQPFHGGCTRLGIENVRDGLVGRGVLIDTVRAKGESLADGYALSCRDLDDALAMASVEIQSGDMVIVRTGYLERALRAGDGAARRRFLEDHPEPGLGMETVPWFREREVAAVATDTLGVEPAPPQRGRRTWGAPLHVNMIRDLGVYLGELWWLEEIAEDCANDGRYAFFLAAQPLHIPGATGSLINPVAIK